MDQHLSLYSAIAPTLLNVSRTDQASEIQYFLQQHFSETQATSLIQALQNTSSRTLSTDELQLLHQAEADFIRSRSVLPSPTGLSGKTSDSPRNYQPQLTISIVFLAAYFLILGAIIMIEASDLMNMKKGENSFMDQIQILLGVLTAGVAHVLSYWFGGFSRTRNNDK